MQVQDIVKKQTLTLSPETTYEAAAQKMHENNVTIATIINEQGTLIGILSEKDLFRAIYPNYSAFVAEPQAFSNNEEEREARIVELRNNPISAFMTEKLFTVEPSTPLMLAGGIMLAHRLHQLPVIEDGKLVGIITREDLFGALLKQQLGF